MPCKKYEPRGNCNPRQDLFCHTFLSNGYNATQAAIAAGYSERTAANIGYTLFHKNKNVSLRLRAIIEEQSTAAGLTNERILKGLMAIAFDPAATDKDRTKALETLAKYRGMFALDNAQGATALGDMLADIKAIPVTVVVAPAAVASEDD